MSVVLFNAPLTTSFQPTSVLMLAKDTTAFNFLIVVANTGPVLLGRIEFYAEYTHVNPFPINAPWFAETAETNLGGGDVRITRIVRRFAEPDGANLAVGAHVFNTTFEKKSPFMRLQIRQVATFADACSIRIDAVSGEIPKQ